jgi:lariat debranching enzyme
MFLISYWFISFQSIGFGREESNSQPGNTLDDEDIKLLGDDEDALADDE